MEKRTTIGRFLYLIGFFMFMSGFWTSLGSSNYILFIPNKSVALIYLFIGMAFLLTSNFFKKRTNFHLQLFCNVGHYSNCLYVTLFQ
ncbi:UNVERIFIED_CONTAM: hypothetical protein BJ099_1427 [Lysinibacillus xylanilyticus]|uniref:hypothetical protein n=1 Tax=Lysinibacillus xylanilyticus TaxID=582475 RepID=UPI000AAA06C0|nr:hypothetical protein [Lysinibacillus xylanilyticus]